MRYRLRQREEMLDSATVFDFLYLKRIIFRLQLEYLRATRSEIVERKTSRTGPPTVTTPHLLPLLIQEHVSITERFLKLCHLHVSKRTHACW